MAAGPPKPLGQELTKGFWEENPVFVLALGLCPILAVTTTVSNAIGMGLAATTVLLGSNTIVSLVKGFVPKGIRIPIFIVIIASFVTMVEIMMKAYAPEMNKSLGIFVPLIVVNCVILGRAEGFASKSGAGRSLLDGLGIGIGFTIALTILAFIRELSGGGTILGRSVGDWFKPASVMILAPGAFIVLGLLLAFFNLGKIKRGEL
jgi:H+/Na+-translocating ferredoxin:NAD+ oxidoreductase subunit E